MNRKELEAVYPLSPLQQGMLFHTLYAPEAGAYAEQMVLRLRGPVHRDTLRRAWQRLVDRHDVLRTAFVWEGVPAPLQAVLRAAELPFSFHDLAETADADARLAALVREDAAHPFALNRAPLLRVALVRMSDGDHRMVASMHHGMVDGWSLSILLGELLWAYAAFLDGAEPDLPPRRPFREYIAWLKKRDPAASEAFWRARLAGFREPTPLPLDRAPARAGRPPERYGRAEHRVPPSMAEALRSEARRRRVTLNTLLHGAWAALLSRWTGIGEVVFATTVAGRPPELTGVEEMVGMFLNTLPVRVTVDDTPVDAWLEAIQQRAGEATRHEHTPLADIRGWTELAQGRPLFETLFVLENHPAEDPRDGGLPDDPRLPEILGGEVGQRTNFALAVTATPTPDGVRLTATSDADRLDDASTARLLAGYAAVLRQLASGEAHTAADLDPVTNQEREILVGFANHALAAYPRESSIHRLFEMVVASSPEAVALRWGGGTITYRELNARANRLARRLRALGVGAESRVGVAMERSPELVAALLAVLKAGGAYVPLDPEYPAERLEHMRRDAGVSLVLTRDDRWRDSFAGARLFSLETEREAIEAEPPHDLEADGDPLALAYVVYTSGSTGTPRGAAVPNRAVVRLVRGQSYACFGPGEVFLQLAPVAFDASTWEIWGALLNGGSLAIHPAGATGARELGGFVHRHGVTAAWLTAGLFHQVVDAGAEGFGGVRRILAGGDVLSPAHVRRARELLPETVLVNGYGPTEATTFTCCHEIRADDAETIPIGRPLANTRAYVLDARLRPVPAGAPGELYVGGDGLGRGYLGRPAGTAAAWLPDPFADEPGARLYRTGDRVRWNARGELEFLGRIDRQVKIRGFRVEPGEVESVLARHPSIATAVVEARHDAAGEKRLVAYVVPSTAPSGDGDAATARDVSSVRGEADADRVRAWLRERLPEHLVPSAVLVLDALPLTPNGKVDRRALPNPEPATAQGDEDAPLTQTEELLAALWREVLGRPRVGPGDDFFALGGHSLLAMRLAARARAVFGAEVPIRAVFDAPVLRAMAARVDALRGGTDDAPPLLPRGGDGPAPLSFGQERIWLTDRLSGGRMAYAVTAVHDFPADADGEVIARALTEIARRHETLRTVFRAEDGVAAQVVLPPSRVELPLLDLRALSAGEREAAVAVAFAEEGGARFDLERGPLLRARLVRLPEAARLVVSMHHAVSDGWSVGVLHRELRALYDAFARGAPPPLPEPTVQYADWAAWQRRLHETGELAAQEAFWRRTLADAPAAIDLPADRPRPAMRGFAGAHQWVRVSTATARAARAFAQREGATLFMVLLAAFDALLARECGTDDVVVGTPVAGRTRPETEGLIGFFVNNLPIRADLSGDPTFREVAARVRKAALDAYAHQDLPFQLLAEAAGVEPTPRHSPVFQVLFALQPRGAEDSPATAADEDAPLPAEPVPGTVEYELALDVRESGEALLVRCSYGTERFDHATARRLAARWTRLLDAVLADPSASIHAHDLGDDEERRSRARALELGDAAAAYPWDGALHARFAAQAARTPEAPALRCEGETVTYAELDARANRLAHHLRALGVGPEVLVGLCVERSPETVVGILAILKAGGAYLPLDPAYPAERLAYMLEDSRAEVVVATAALADRLPSAVRVVRIDADAGAIHARPSTAPVAEVSADSLAYVIYTSGSTGRPKGVQVTHGNVLRLFDATAARFAFGADDVWTLFHSYAFDFSVWEIWGALLHGGRLVVVPFYLSRAPDAFLRLLAAERVTVLNQTPSAFRQLIRADAERSAGETAELALRWVIFGGEALDPSTLAPWMEKRGIEAPRLVNMYGITETTVHVTFRLIGEHDVRAGTSSPLGAPLADLSARVLDARGRAVAAGTTGEMYVGGAGVARGYLGRPGLTAERFVPDPFARVPGARLYRSGDLARWGADGGLEYLGRGDDQVKVRGFRIELGEIEAVLRRHAGVRDAVVLARGEGDSKRLVAWITAGGDAPPAAELRAHALARLPEYMVPAAFVALDAIPLTRNGKVDRRALPAPTGEGTETFVPPRTATEQVLAAVWAGVLEVERVGADDSFFALGGHSLLATRVVSRLRDAFGIEVPLRAAFERPTLGALAAEVDRLVARNAGVDAPPLVPVARDGDAPLSFAQERLWFVDRMEPGSSAYHMPFAFRLRGALAADALQRALDEVVARHQALRTSFPLVDGAPVQRVHPPEAADLAFHDLSALPTGARAGEEARLWSDAAERPFDLERGPLFRALLARAADDDHLFVLTLHHLVGDGWSWGVLARELAELYGAFAAGGESRLPPLAVQYADFAAWQREWLRGEVLEAQLAYWRARLAGAPPRLELPTDFPRPAVQRHHGQAEQRVMEGTAAAAVRELARAAGATPFMALLAAWSVVLARLAGQDEVVVGTPIAGRARGETEPLIGLFLNSLALRADLSGEPTFRQLLSRIRATTLEAYAHQDVPFERVLEALRPERSLAHAPVFQAMLNLANFGDAALELPGVRVEPLGAGEGVASKVDLTLYAAEGEDALGLTLVYDADLFAAPRMREMLAQLAAVLERAAADPDVPVSSLSLVTDAARDVLPDPTLPLPAEWRGSVPGLFARRAAETPDAIAAEDPRERWTYAELETDTAGLARRLAEAGVRPGEVVAIHGHRSVAFVRALLAVLRAGAAFLVLDPAYPPVRLAAYIRAAAPRAFLRVAAAGPTAAEVEAAVRATSLSTLEVRARADGGVEDAPAGPAPVTEIGPDSLAYLSFTSGTTGAPKAVMGRHGSLTHFTPWLAERFGLGRGDRFSLLSGLAHDPLHRDVFTPLQIGAAVVAPDPESVLVPGSLAAWMRERAITVAHLTPAMGQLLADVPPGAPPVGSLRRAFFVGDVLTRADVERLHALAPALEVVNYYGSTETQRAVSYHPVPRPASALAKESVPAGTGIPGVQLVVRGPGGGRAGVGELGEIWMRSPHLALGYLGDAELTAARFAVNPWTGDTADRMYRTGDLGRYRPDGVVEIAGRADRQVKVRGFRVEPGEIEAALRAHPAVRDAAVLARGDGEARRLVAWVVRSDAGRGGVDALRAHLSGLLPDYMVPTAFVEVAALPLTPNGKLDRAALPDPEPAASGVFIPLVTETERTLAAAWSELLAVEEVSASANFFHLGGHSLLATRLAARVRAALGVELPLRAVFEHPTLAALAAAVDTRHAASPERAGPLSHLRTPAPPHSPSDENVHPVSFAQRRLWLLDRLEPGNAAYNLGGGVRLRGALDVSALERALGETVRRHEALRTRIETRSDEPVQVVDPPSPFHLPRLDRPGIGGDALAALATDEVARPFDLARGPLFRARLVRMAEDEHALLWAMHHVVSDAWSIAILLDEVAAHYEAFARGLPSPLPPLPTQYGPHAARERARLEGVALDAEVRWWKEALAGAPALLELPTDRTRPAVRSDRGAALGFRLPLGSGARVEAFARGEGATPFMVLLAAFQAVLARWSGQRDVVVGTPVAGRRAVEVEPLIGFFANTLAIRGRLDGDPSFREAVGRAREAALGAFEHQDLPFERLVEELAPERSLGHSPVFQALLALQNVPQARMSLGGLEMEPVGREATAAKFDLSLSLLQRDGEVDGVAEYATDLFDAATVERFVTHLGTLLEAALAEPDARLSALPLMDAEERAAVVRFSAGPLVSRDPALTLHGMFERQAARAPGATALTFGGARMTYGELDARANQVARLLRARGVGTESPVAVVMDRSPEMVLALYGILKADGCYVPADPENPPARIAEVLDDCGARVVLTRLREIELLPASIDAVALDRPGLFDGLAASPVAGAADPDALAYVIFTSGSTGRPKGAGNTHRAVVNRILWMQDTFGLGADDVVLQKTPFTFDVSVWEFFWPLMAGARLAVAAPGAHREPARLSDAIAAEGVTVAHFVPSLLSGWLDDESAARCASLRRVMSSGEALHAALRDRFFARLPRAELHNLYGPTEAAVDVTWHPLSSGDRSPTVPIGRPIANTRIHLLDVAGNPCPIGVPGELSIAGAQVGRGYARRPALTAERFVPDPFAGEPGARMYRTGDRARWTAAGVLEYLGRLDFQVKVRGVRIEPGEIEAALLADPAVREAVVVTRPGAAGDPVLAAYVVAAGAEVSPDALRDGLRRRLPTHLVPGAIVALEAMPLTPSGKVDRAALPAPDAAPAAHRPPATPVEEVLAGIWAEVLRRERAGAGDDFFALGGHSLLAALVVSRVRERLGVELPLRAVFEAPVLADQAARVEAELRGGAAANLPPITRVEDAEPPLSFAQERLWFIDRLEPGTTAYNLAAALRLRGALHVDALKRAVAELVRRHEPLRTSFPEVDGAPVQRILPATPVPLSSSPVAGEAVARRVEEAAARPFDLARGPLFRAELLRVEDDDHVLVLAMHHAVSDGWSMGIVLRELAALYGAFAGGRPSPLPELPVRYADHAAWQRRWLDGEVLERQAAWWRERLAGAPALLALPTDRPRPATRTGHGARHRFTLEAPLAEAVHALARKEGATPFMVLLAALQAALWRWSGEDDVVVGTPVAGRTRRETEGLVGLFVNTLALRGDLSSDPDFRALLGRVREATLGAYAHQELPFERLVEALHPERSLGHSPVFQVLFAYQNVPAAESEGFPGLEASGVPYDRDTAQLDLSLSFDPAPGGGLAGTLEYATDLFDAGTVARFADRLLALLGAALRDPSVPVAALSLLRDDERAELLRLSAGPAFAVDGARPVVERLAELAALRPGAIAIEMGDDALTYRVLDATSNRVARLLRARGVGPETPVALVMERSPESVLAFVATLKAGGCVVPIDPSFPPERIAWMLDDSGARTVLAQARWSEGLPSDVDVVALDAPGALDGFSDAPVEGAAPPEALAYLIYTSGSTGAPKGVAVPHGALAYYAATAGPQFGFTAADRVLHRTAASFDPAVSEIWLALAAGATLVVAPPAAHADPAALARLVADARVTVADLVPTLLAALLDEPAFTEAAPRLVFSGGEALTPALAGRAATLLPNARIVNAYGPTETTITATAWEVEGAAETVSIGTPASGVRAYVLDPRGEPSPVGVPGELFVGGALVARGYWRRPALTAERFVPDPFAEAPGARMYRTGDRARWTAAERLEYLGRLDFQLKVRGMRVEPGEIEAALLADPAVRDAVVVTRPNAAGDAVLAAYVAAADDAPVHRLRDGLRRRLPAHLVPGAIVRLDALPRTPNGKVDRAALPDPETAGGEAYLPPFTPAEIEMADVWREVLGVERVGAADDFFALGGHSLLAVRLVARIRERFGREVPLAELFRSPTLGALAEAVAGESEREASPLVALRAGGTLPPLFFVHPAGGTVFRYADLARRLGADQPLYGLQARGIGDDRPAIAEMEEMVDHYLAAVREAFPSGPYLLGGWSSGGPIAFAMAARLRELGEDAPLVILLDSFAPGHGHDPAPMDDVELYARFAADLAGADPAAAEALRGELRGLAPEWREAAVGDWVARNGPEVPAALVAQVGRTVRVWTGVEAALRGWRLPRFGGDVLFLQSAEGSPGIEPPPGGLAAGWAPRVDGRLEVRVVPGAHATMVLEPAVEAVAREIRRALAAAPVG